MQNIDDLVERHDLLKLRAQAVQDELKKVRAQVLEHLEAAGATTLKTSTGRQITRVEAENRQWDTTVLRDILQPLGVWDDVKVVIEDFDRDKLLHLIDSGRVEEGALEPAFEVKKSEPYPRISAPRKPAQSSHQGVGQKG